MPAFAFPGVAGTHLPTPAELAWMAGYVVRQFACSKAVAHPTTNWDQCSATALIETNALPLHKTVDGRIESNKNACSKGACDSAG